MEMHEYLSELTGQIRSKKARQEVAREISRTRPRPMKMKDGPGMRRLKKRSARWETLWKWGLIWTGSTGPVITGWFWAWQCF